MLPREVYRAALEEFDRGVSKDGRRPGQRVVELLLRDLIRELASRKGVSPTEAHVREMFDCHLDILVATARAVELAKDAVGVELALDDLVRANQAHKAYEEHMQQAKREGSRSYAT